MIVSILQSCFVLKVTKIRRKMFCEQHSSDIVRYLENLFYKWGRFVARKPWQVIITCLILTLVCSFGFMRFTFESDPNKLWIPKGSKYLANKKWLSDNFPQDKRIQTLIFKANGPNGNILSPESLKLMLKIHEMVSLLSFDNTSFEDICER